MVQTCPISPIAPKNRWPVDRVEVNIVFAHELVQADIVGIQPPLFPFRRVTGCDTWVPNASVELVRGSFATPFYTAEQCLPRHLKKAIQREKSWQEHPHLTEDLSFHAVLIHSIQKRNGDPPSQVSCYRARAQSTFQPRINDLPFRVNYRVGRPFPCSV